MAQDSDVARVAAALKAPGIRYKSFGNDPVRSMAQPVENVANSAPLLEAAASLLPSEPPVEPQGDTAPELTVQAPPGAPVPAPWRHEPPPVSTAPPPAQLPVGAAPGHPEPAPPHQARGEFPGFGAMTAPQHQSHAQAPTHPPAPVAPGFCSPTADPGPASYRLLEALGQLAGSPGPVSQPPAYPSPASAGTLGSLLGPEASVPMRGFGPPASPQPAFHHAGGGQFGGQSGLGPAGFGPAALSTGTWPSPLPTSALLPAALVTLPLAEVMRLVAVGAPVVSSPFAAFRVSGGAPHAR